MAKVAHMSLRTPLAALGAVALAIGTVAAPASAATNATAAQTAAITKAIQTTPVADVNQTPKAWYTVGKVKISSVSKSWAVGWQLATKAGSDKFQPAYFILVNPAGTKGWTVVDAGTALVGCGIAPNSVIKDLVGGCPPSEGVKG
jgi:hypothetical protein